MKLLKEKKGLEMQYIIVLVILLLFLLFVILWYSGLGKSVANIINSFLK